MSNTNLSLLDEQKLDHWVNDSFTPYFMTFFLRTKQMSIGNPPRSEVIDLINESEIFISLLLWYGEYVKSYGDPNYSSAALTTRSEFIGFQIQILRAEISDFLSSSGIILPSKNVIRNIYRSNISFLNLTMPNRIAITVKQFGSNLQDDIISNDNTSGNQGSDDNIGTTAETNTNSDQSSGSKSGNLLLLALLGLGIYVVASSSPGDDDNSNEKKVVSKKS
jgi:hypothetical protein